MKAIETVHALPVATPGTPMADPNQRFIDGPDAEDIRSANRAISKLRFELSDCVVLINAHEKKINELDTKRDQTLEDLDKKVGELQKMIDGAFAKTGLDLKAGWKYDAEKVLFYK